MTHPVVRLMKDQEVRRTRGLTGIFPYSSLSDCVSRIFSSQFTPMLHLCERTPIKTNLVYFTL